MSEDNGTTTIETKWGKITGKKTSELIAALCLAVMAVGAYAFYKHEESTKDNYTQLAVAIKELAVSQQDSAKAQRVSNCILDKRFSGVQGSFLSECERITR